MDTDALHNWMGSDKHVGLSDCVVERRKRTSLDVVEEDGTRRTFFTAPAGRLELVEVFDGPSRSWHPVAHPVASVDDVALMTEWYEDITPELDMDGLAKARARAASVGEGGVTAMGIGTSALMHWVEFLAGIENAHYLLIEHPALVAGLFDAMHRVTLRRAEIACEHHPADLLYMVENTSTTLISPRQYRDLCYGHIRAYAEAARDAGRLLILHMCGHLKALLPDLATLAVAGFEAFTSPPVGNTSFMDGRRACPETCLIGGTNAVLWTKSAEAIIAEIEASLDALPHHRGLVVTSAGVMPPLCAPETIKAVGDWVKTYPVRM